MSKILSTLIHNVVIYMMAKNGLKINGWISLKIIKKLEDWDKLPNTYWTLLNWVNWNEMKWNENKIW